MHFLNIKRKSNYWQTYSESGINNVANDNSNLQNADANNRIYLF